jgi:endonuclease/exonuclease/phosphatase family metal-dependent hydrolase
MKKRLALSVFGYCISLFILVLLGLGFFLWWGVSTTLPTESTLEVAPVVGVTPPKAPPTLTVVSYNIGHAQGIKENAWDYREKEITINHLNNIGDAMTAMDADIFLLQEVDLDSKRTFHINQLNFLKNKTGHPYSACSLVWEKNYIPFPYWPINHHMGYMRSANCILSRFPLSTHYRYVFEKPKSNPFWYNWGYIDRVIERVDVTIGEQKIAVLNVHLEAWDKPTREDQIKILWDYMNKIDEPIIVGGDFNTVPPGAEKMTGFADDKNADYSDEKTMPWFYSHAPKLIIPKLDGNKNDPFTQFTFESGAPDRRLDYIFLMGKNMSFIDFRVVKEAGVASDHLPVLARISYK